MEINLQKNSVDFDSLIKNYEKYNEIALKPALNLTKLPKEKREGNVGISTKESGRVWHITSQGKVLFKAPTGKMTGVEESEIRKLNEVVAYQLARLAGLNCAKYATAKSGKDVGVASYNFLKENETLINFAEFCKDNEIQKEEADYYRIAKALENGAYAGCKFDIKKLKRQMYEQLVFDTLLLQTDRNLSNISFVLNEETMQLNMAPIHDNEFAFMTNCLYYAKYYDEQENPGIKGYVNSCYLGVLGARPFLYDTMQAYGTELPFIDNMQSIVKCAKDSEELKESLLKIIKYCTPDNLNKIYNALENAGNKINEDYKNYTISLLKYTSSEFKREMLSENILDSNSITANNNAQDELSL